MNYALKRKLSNKDKKRYEKLISLINKGDYQEFFDEVVDRERRFTNSEFGFTNLNYRDNLLKKVEQEALSNINFYVQISINGFERFRISQIVLKQKPEYIERLIEEKEAYSSETLYALENGYNPGNSFINEHIEWFGDNDVMKKLIDNGYKPTDEIIENNYNIFRKEEFLLRAFDWGYVPSYEFIMNNKLLTNPKLASKILDIVEITPELFENKLLLNNTYAQKIVLEKNPNILLDENVKRRLDRRSNDELFYQFWIEAFKMGIISEEVLNYRKINTNPLLFSKIVKYDPQYVKYCNITDSEEREKIHKLALSLGYVPTISDIKSSTFLKTSFSVMKELISRRPEAIKYVETRPLEGSYSLDLKTEDFFDLVRFSLESGYVPSIKDLEHNPRLADSFDIMKILIQDKPELINNIRNLTPKQEELLKIAIENGFNGYINGTYYGRDSSFRYGTNSLIYSETGLMYQLEKRHMSVKDLEQTVIKEPYHFTNKIFSINFYNYLISKGCKADIVIDLFSSSFETLKEIIKTNPEFITRVSKGLSREQIDELGLLAIKCGYKPKFGDEIFGYGLETALMMVKENPNYLEKVELFDRLDILHSAPCSKYDELCSLAVNREDGFIPDVNKMGNIAYTVMKYNYSYDIMKKAIPLRPSLIEACAVENKEKYDELCRLAISCGYEPTSEYTLTHEGSKMCSSYDLMAKYLEKNPEFLLEVEVTEPLELIKLIDIAVKAKPDLLNKLSEKELFKLFSYIDETKWKDYLDSEMIEKLQKAQKMKIHNSRITNTLDSKFLSSEIYKNLSESQIEILSCYPNIQQDLIKITTDESKRKIILEIISKYANNLEWVPLLEHTLINIDSVGFSSLINSLDIEELTEEEKEKLIYLLITDNHLDIASIEELKNLDSLRQNYIDTLIERNTLNSLKTEYFERNFGIDLYQAIRLVTTYGESLKNSTMDSVNDEVKEEFVILENMKKIIDLNDIEILRYYIKNVNPPFTVTPDLMVTYEARLKYLFTKLLNDSFTKPNLEDKIENGIKEEEKDFDIYYAAGENGDKKCRMMISSVGAYTNMEEPDDYYASWNVNTISSHGLCCSYVGESNLGTARVKYCCLGFTDFENGSLQLSGPYDLCSYSPTDSYQVTSLYPCMYLLPDDIQYYTRHTHNETVWERRNITENIQFKKQPSYIVYFVDNFEDRLSDPEAMKQWESTKKAAKDFSREIDGETRPLPIMVVEREKIAINQKKQIDEDLDKFKHSLDPNLIESIIVRYESNYAGCREYHPHISEKYFPQHEKLSDSVVGVIIEKIKSQYYKNPSKAVECISVLEQTVLNEEKKYNNAKHGTSHSVSSFDIEEALTEIHELKSKFIMRLDSTLRTINSCDDNFRQFEKNDITKLEDETLENQLSSFEVMQILTVNNLIPTISMYENEINNEKVNSELKVHGQRHIKNVLLYSSIIGQEIVENKHDLDLLMLAAKYHDIGRKSDAREEHALRSSKIAKEKLKDTCSFDDLGVISTIIEFHEIPRRSSYANEKFMEIATKNGVKNEDFPKVKQLASILKDADALDRTRFINKARLSPDFLEFDISKNLVRFASSMQESYALDDLKRFHCDKEIAILLETYTPQEILRNIRHSVKTKNLQVTKTFIRLWSDYVSENKHTEYKKGK